MRIARYAAIVISACLAWPVGEARLHVYYPLQLYSQEGILIREFRNAQGSYGSALNLEKYPADLVRAVLLAEDARYLSHSGVDFFAVARALAPSPPRRCPCRRPTRRPRDGGPSGPRPSAVRRPAS